MGAILSVFEKTETPMQNTIPLRHRPTTLSSVFEAQLDEDVEKGTSHGSGAPISVGVSQN